MKKLLLSLMVICTGGALLAQGNPIGYFYNFTATSSNGVTVDLFTELGKGKTIVTEFYFNECGWCQTHAPTLEQIYQAKIKNTTNVDLWTFHTSASSTDAMANTFKATYGSTNKFFTGAGGKNALDKIVFSLKGSGQHSFGTPTYCVICPNKKGYWAVNYPPTLNGFDSYIAKCQSLASGVNDIVLDENRAKFVSIYPSPSNGESTIEFYVAEQGLVEITMFNLLGEQVGAIANEKFDAGTHEVNLSATHLNSGNYIIKMITEAGVQDVAKIIIAD